MPAAETICQEADRLVSGDRQATYGHPIHDFTRTAKMWSAILGADVTAEQVALCMVAVKISRECNKHKRDNLVDGCGYLKCLDLIHEVRDTQRELELAQAPADIDDSQLCLGLREAIKVQAQAHRDA